MDVAIVKKSTNQVVAQYPVFVKGENYEPSDAEHFELAWKCAVDDGIVKALERDKYELRRAD